MFTQDDGLFNSNELFSMRFWLPCETPTKDPMESAVIRKFSGPIDPKIDALA